MIHIPSLKLCFLHIPKTAGTWVRSAIRGTSIYTEEFGIEFEHADLEKASHLMPPGTSYFTAVRHPFSWLRSYWVDRQLKGWGGDLAIGHHCQNDDFELFVRTVCNLKPGYVTELFGRYIGPWHGNRSHVIRSEEVGESLCRFLRSAVRREHGYIALTRIRSLPPLNPGAAYPAFHARTEGTPELFDLVRRSEPLLYKAFEYATEPPPRVKV